MSKGKRRIRDAFRAAVFTRDGYRCRICGRSMAPRWERDYLTGVDVMVDEGVELDAHHITSRKEFPHGGYVASNGITLCRGEDGCHAKAEAVLRGQRADPTFAPARLYQLIGSSEIRARREDRPCSP